MEYLLCYKADMKQNCPSIDTVKLTARVARDQLNAADASPSPLPGGPLRAPPNKGNGVDSGASRHEQAHAEPHPRDSSAALCV